MAQNLTFLTAAVPLVKKFEAVNGTLVKHAYPLVKNFTSSTEEVAGIRDVFNVIKSRASDKSKPCLLKGDLIAPLENESRAQMCSPDTTTSLVCFDFDKAPYTTPSEAMKAIGLDDVSYVWQYSSSAKLVAGDKRLSGHAFVMVDKPMHPKAVRAWLMYLNLHTDSLKKSIGLSNSKAALHWPLDIVVNDNNRLIYIADPEFKGLPNPIAQKDRIQFVQRKVDVIFAAKIPDHSLEALKQQQRTLINELRKVEGIPAIKAKTKMVGEWEVQTGVGEATTYQVMDCGDYFRYNLNGGDSQAYWHHKSSFEYLHSFKGEATMLLKEILPQRYAELHRTKRDDTATPNQDGDLLLAFRDKVTADYWKGVWNPSQHKLDIHRVKSELQLDHFLQGHGQSLGPFIPEWQMVFDPHADFVVDVDNHRVNQFVAPVLLRAAPEARKVTYPNIQRVLDHAVGKGAIQEHFLNWLAVIVQKKRKTQTAWVLHGTEGTGKGVIINRVLKPMFERYLVVRKASELRSEFNAWMETALIAFIEEIEVDSFERKSIEGDLKNAITEPTWSVRRMRTDSYEAPSFINFIFSSNKPQPVRIPVGDRRFNVGVYQPLKLELTTHEVEVVIPSEVDAFARYLHTRAADVDKAAQVLHTEDRAAIQMLGVTSVDEFAGDITSGNLYKLFDHLPDERLMNEHGLIDATASAYVAILKRCLHEEESKLSRDELKILFTHAVGKVPEGANKFTSFLRHHGIVTKKVWTGGGPAYGISVNWKITPAEKQELQRFFAPSDKKLRRAS